MKHEENEGLLEAFLEEVQFPLILQYWTVTWGVPLREVLTYPHAIISIDGEMGKRTDLSLQGWLMLP